MNFETPSQQIEPAGPALQAYLLGTVEFDAALALQRRLVYQVSGDPSSMAIILCEHVPLITVGRQGSWAHIRCDETELRARHWSVRWVNRGGGCWLHLPGQLAIYPVVSLAHWQLGIREYLDRLQSILRALLDDFGIQASTSSGQVGLRVGARPIASVGVAVRDWVAYFGAILNVCPTLDAFRLVRQGPTIAESMTSLQREKHGPLRFSLVRERLLEHFASHFPCERTSLFFDPPSMQRKAATDAIASHR